MGVGLQRLFPFPVFRASGQIDPPGGDGCPTCQGDQQERYGSAEGSDCGPASAPTCEPFNRTHGSPKNRYVAEESPEFVGQFPRCRITSRWFLLKAFKADRFQIARQAWVQQSWRDRLRALHLHQDRTQSLTLERWTPGQQMIKQGTGGIDIGGD